jgi:ABC-type Fe3+-hydroxamate transport system substrate-binding protein
VPTLGPRLVISGTQSGVGKTTVATGLMAAFALKLAGRFEEREAGYASPTLFASRTRGTGWSTGRPLCRRTTLPVTVTAQNGAVTIPASPKRIVSMSATATQMLYAIGAGPRW